MKQGPMRTAVRIGAIICIIGFVAYGISYLLIRYANGSNVALPFMVVGFFLSLPSVILAGDPFDKPVLFFAMLPVALILNSVLISLVIWAFLRVKAITDKKVYGIEESQQPHPETTSENASFQGTLSEASDA